MDKIYIAGPLNSNAEGYIINLHNMFKTGNTVRKMGASPHIPGRDWMDGFFDGTLDYNSYFNDNLVWLKTCDAVMLCDGYQNSKGAMREKEIAESCGMPIFDNLIDLKAYINRPKILAIVGESGSGKSLISDYIEQHYNINLVKSYTTRPQRPENDDGHTFISNEEFNFFTKDEMVAYTEWQGNRYCCLHNDIKDANTYVIDESGLLMLKALYSDRYKVKSLRVYRDKLKRVSDVGLDRVGRDEGKFNLYPRDFDYIVRNDGSLHDLFDRVDLIVNDFF